MADEKDILEQQDVDLTDDQEMVADEVQPAEQGKFDRLFGDEGNLKKLTGKSLDALHIIGGGSKDTYLSELTAARIDIPVYTGPTEATAIGNILAQMLATKVFGSISEAREAVFNSFDVKKV